MFPPSCKYLQFRLKPGSDGPARSLCDRHHVGGNVRNPIESARPFAILVEVLLDYCERGGAKGSHRLGDHHRAFFVLLQLTIKAHAEVGAYLPLEAEAGTDSDLVRRSAQSLKKCSVSKLKETLRCKVNYLDTNL